MREPRSAVMGGECTRLDGMSGDETQGAGFTTAALPSARPCIRLLARTQTDWRALRVRGCIRGTDLFRMWLLLSILPGLAPQTRQAVRSAEASPRPERTC